MTSYPIFTLAHRGPFTPQSAQNRLSSFRIMGSSSATTPDLFVPFRFIFFRSFTCRWLEGLEAHSPLITLLRSARNTKNPNSSANVGARDIRYDSPKLIVVRFLGPSSGVKSVCMLVTVHSESGTHNSLPAFGVIGASFALSGFFVYYLFLSFPALPKYVNLLQRKILV